MPILLPTSPQPADANVRLITARNEQEAAFGGNTQRLNRKGSRYAMDVLLPAMFRQDAMPWLPVRNEDDTVVMVIPQPGFTIPAEGTPLVDGAGQAGRSLAIKGVAAQTIKAGRYLSIIHAGEANRRRTYMIDQDVVVPVTAPHTGIVTVHLETLLRQPPSANDVVELFAPKIEGFATPSEDAFRYNSAGHCVPQFTIKERG